MIRLATTTNPHSASPISAAEPRRAPAPPSAPRVARSDDPQSRPSPRGGRPVTVVENPAYRDGLSTSIRAGVGALPAGFDAVVFLLADMPRVRATHIDRLISAFAKAGRPSICVPTHGGRQGNPVLWGADYLPDLLALAGDVGGRALLARHADRVHEVEMPDDAVLIDVDQPSDLAALLADPAPGHVLSL